MEIILSVCLFALGFCAVAISVMAYLILSDAKRIDRDINDVWVEIIGLEDKIKALYDAGPIGCKVCGANLFVQIEDEWLCKECRQPAPVEFVVQIKVPESRTLN